MLKPDIHRLQAGDRFSWECAFYWLAPVAVSAVERRLLARFPNEVEDVVSVAIKQVADEATKGNRIFRSFEELTAFTVVVADRRAKDHIRSMQAERRSSSATETIEGRPDLISKSPSPLELADAHNVAKLLLELSTVHLREIPSQLLKEHYFDGLTQQQLAENHNMSLGTVGVTLSRSLQKLRKEIEKHPELMKELKEALR